MSSSIFTSHLDTKPEIVAGKIGQERRSILSSSSPPKVPQLDVRNVSREVYTEHMSSRTAKQLLTFRDGSSTTPTAPNNTTVARTNSREGTYRGGRRHVVDPATQRPDKHSRRRFVSADSARLDMEKSRPRCESVPKIPSLADIGCSPSRGSTGTRLRQGEGQATPRSEADYTPSLKVRGDSAARFAARTFTSSLDNWTGSASATLSDSPKSIRGSSVVKSLLDRDRLSHIPIGSRSERSQEGSPRSIASTPRGYSNRVLGSSQELLEAFGNDGSAIPVCPSTPRSTSSRRRTVQGAQTESTPVREDTPTNLRWDGSFPPRRERVKTSRPPPKAWNAGLGRKLFA
ncbi:hypothetical protein FOL47_002228 [Perkinsus chesapeaki]|uniref:Uncharacterized protein n=1 Tax=Perkinsus chesapeaki TaxID=330153 RepID=A0A7J6KQ67_PERCH|nr:hypothetical protein FOL47_002228 [Perkinsus chesapeaki]